MQANKPGSLHIRPQVTQKDDELNKKTSELEQTWRANEAELFLKNAEIAEIKEFIAKLTPLANDADGLRRLVRMGLGSVLVQS